GRDRDPHRIVHEHVGELHDVVAEGRREEHRLATLVGRELAQEVAQVLDEAHVEHAVGFVDDQDLHAAEIEDALLVVVDQPPGRPSASGRTFSWMGVQCVKPAARMPAMTGSGRSKVANLRPVRGAAGSAAGAVESGITSPSHAGGGGRKSSRRGLDPRAWGMGQNPRMSARPEAARIMLGFVVRQCAVALGHAPEGARRLFADLDAALAAQLRAGDVLVAGQQLGAGPGGGEAARALAAAGVIAVVAGSFAPGFAEAVLAAGLPPLEVDAPA